MSLDEDAGESILFDIIGYASGWTHRAKKQDPRESARYAGNTPLCDVGESKRTRKGRILTKTEDLNAGLDSKDASYDCHDYVLEILDVFVENGIIDANDPDCMAGRQALAENYGK